jgi:type II secretory pathway pseudopilin PulG
MTLIEIIVVLVIVAALLGLATTSFSVLSASKLNGEARRMASTIELVYGRAALNGRRYRLMLDLDENSYWTECADVDVGLPMDIVQGDQGEQNGTHRFLEFERYEDDDEEADPFNMNLQSMFDDCTEPLIPVRTLPEGVVFDSVLTTHQADPFISGQASIAFFGNGFAERTIIWLAEDKEGGETGGVMTLEIEPMSGRVYITSGRAEIPDSFFDIEEDR